MRLRSGETLRALLAERQISARELARSAGIHESMISKLIANTKGCGPRTALAIAKGLGDPAVSVDFLFRTRVQDGSPSSQTRHAASPAVRGAA